MRHRTTGIIEANFPVPFQNQEWLFRVTDVGGQRAERKKFCFCFVFSSGSSLLWFFFDTF